jgi:hypothetical protein
VSTTVAPPRRCCQKNLAKTTTCSKTSMAGLLVGCCRWVGQRPPPKLEKTSMVGPLGVLPASLTMPTTEVAEVVNGGPLGGCCPWVRQRPPPKLEKTSMEGPLGGATGESGSGHHRNWRRHRWWAPLGGAAGGAITEVEEDVDGRPLGGCYRWVRWRPPPKLEKTSMVGPLGVLPAGPAASTIDIGEDVNGGICPF